MGAGPPIPTFGTLNLATSYPDEKSPANANTNDPEKSHSDDDSDSSKEDVQDGVKKIEAMASVWTKRDLYIAYFGYAKSPG